MERREFIKAMAAAAAVHGIPATAGEEKKDNIVTTVPWYRRSWQMWPAGLQAVSLVALLAMFGGAMLALAQNELKRMLAFSTIDDLGFLLLGLIVGGPLGIAAEGHQALVDPDIALVLPVEQAQQVKQRALAAAGRTDHGVNLAALRLEGDALEHVHPALPLAEGAVDVGAAKRDVVRNVGHG